MSETGIFDADYIGYSAGSLMRAPLFLALVFLAGSCQDRQAPPPAKAAVKPNPVSPRSEGPAIEYTLRFTDAKNHYLEVEAIFPASGDETTLAMAVWAPGSYLVREFAKSVEGLTATSLEGAPLRVEKTRKNRWRVTSKGLKRFALRYRVYCRELAVQSNFVNADAAVLNGGATFITLAEGMSAPHDVKFEKPAAWKELVTAMPAHPDGAAGHFLAPNFDILVDSPVIAGDVTRHRFTIGNVEHELANLGEGGIWDGPRSAADVQKIVQTQVDFWGVLPYPRYVFQNVLLEGRGGLEHLDSTQLMGSRFATQKRKDYLGWLGLVSHEFFHTWNVKRMRPAALGPFDYENEIYTSSLWIAEGFTSYYDDLLVARAGLATETEFLESLSEQIEAVETSPGRLVQSLADSSFDAWIKHYRSNENSGNTAISYYRKGALVALLLDTEIRNASGGKRSLDDAMRLMYQRFSGATGYTPRDFEQVCAEVAGRAVDAFFRDYVDGTKPLDYGPFLKRYGLRFGDDDDDKEDKAKEPPGFLGVESNGSIVTTVKRQTPAYEAGINPDDEILAIDSMRVAPGGLDARLEFYRPGTEVKLLIARRGEIKTIPVKLGKKPEATWKLSVDSGAGGSTAQQRSAWLKPSRTASAL